MMPIELAVSGEKIYFKLTLTFHYTPRSMFNNIVIDAVGTHEINIMIQTILPNLNHQPFGYFANLPPNSQPSHYPPT
jgi:hypothetical protein